jgi:hypothetical protein
MATDERPAHWPHCLLLAAAAELLRCGLDDLLAEGMARIPPLPPPVETLQQPPSIFRDFAATERDEADRCEALLRLAVVLVLAQKTEIRQTLQRLADAHRSSVSEPSTHRRAGGDPCRSPVAAVRVVHRPLTATGEAIEAQQAATWRYAAVARDAERGRHVRTRQALGAGVVVCRDAPVAVCLRASCGCRYAASGPSLVLPLLVEHVALATALYRATDSLDGGAGGAAQLPSHLRAVFALLDGHLAPPAAPDDRPGDDNGDDGDVDRGGDGQQATWSAPQLRVLATLAALVVVMHDDRDDDDDGDGDASDASSAAERHGDVDATAWAQAEAAVEAQRLQWRLTDAAAKATLTRRALRLFRLLVRLPTNTHAVSSLAEDAATHTLQASVVGYAVFLQASAVNHSCAANATIRYHCDATAAAAAGGDARSLLDALRVDVVTTAAVARDAEVSVCYGPLYPRHSYAQRQRALRQQYLFVCRCAACRDECVALCRARRAAATVPPSDSDRAYARQLRLRALTQRLQEAEDDARQLNVALTTLLALHQRHDAARRPAATETGVQTALQTLTSRLQRWRLSPESTASVSASGDSVAYDAPPTPQSSLSPSSCGCDTLLRQLLALATSLERDAVCAQLLAPTFGRRTLAQLLVLRCDADDRDAAQRFARLDFRRFVFPPRYTTTFATYPTPPPPPPPPLTDDADAEGDGDGDSDAWLTPQSDRWKPTLALWCVVLDLQAQCLASLAAPQSLAAAQRVNFAVNLMIAGGLYSRDDICVARERVKMASLYLAGGDWPRCRRRVRLALPVLRLHCGAGDGGAGTGACGADKAAAAAAAVEAAYFDALPSDDVRDPDYREALQLWQLTTQFERRHASLHKAPPRPTTPAAPAAAKASAIANANANADGSVPRAAPTKAPLRTDR